MHRKATCFVGLLVAAFFGANVVTIGQNREFRLNGKPFFPIMQWMHNDFLVRSEVQYGINLFSVPGNSVAGRPSMSMP